MYLRFIGANGSLKLTHGEVYNVKVKTKDEHIVVMIPNFEHRHMIFGTWKCLYSSPQSFAENWEKA